MFYPTRADESLCFTLGSKSDKIGKRKKDCYRLATKKAKNFDQKKVITDIIKNKKDREICIEDVAGLTY